MRRWLWRILLGAVIVVPRVYLWGTVPAGMHGDEGGFARVGETVFTAPTVWGFGPQSLPLAHFWLYGAGLELFGYSVWSARAVTALFGLLQAIAVVDIARLLGGRAAALAAAIAMAVPLQLHFDRLAMCNVITTSTWAMALWCLVRFPRRWWAAAAAGGLLALGWYGYQASRITPLIVAAGLAPLLVSARTRGAGLRSAAVGTLAFAVVLAPLAHSFHRDRYALLGRAQDTSWVQKAGDLRAALVSHAQSTGGALFGLERDRSGGFFPYEMPVLPLGFAVLALVGVLASGSVALGTCLTAWIALVLLGNFLRHQFPVYSPVLICLVPALALAAGLTARWIGWVAPVVVAALVAQPLLTFYDAGSRVPRSEVIPMSQAALLHGFPDADPVLLAGGVGCGHGMTAFALRGRRCLQPPDGPDAPLPDAELYIVYPSHAEHARALATRRELTEYQFDWNGLPVRVWSTRAR